MCTDCLKGTLPISLILLPLVGSFQCCVSKALSPQAEDVTPRRLTSMGLDIARGLQYLTDMKFVHR